MIIEQVIDKDGSYFIAQGEGPLRLIIAEGNTRGEARKLWSQIFGQQYEEGERRTEQSLRMTRHLEKNRDDYRQMIADIHTSRGDW